MRKAIKYGLNGALIGGIGNGLLNAIDQLINKNHPFNWGQVFKAAGKGALLVGGGAALIGAGVDYFNDQEELLDTDAIISGIVSKIQLDKKYRRYQRLRAKSDWLIDVIYYEFSGLLKAKPYRFGSTENGSALKEHFDIDICASFLAGSFASTAEMYFTVLKRLESYVGKNQLIKVREQKKSIGMFFLIDDTEQKIDILPHKLSLADKNDTSGYLYVNNKGLLQKPSRTKTDIDLLNSVTLNATQNKILILLKKWKKSEHLPISSHLLRYLILRAYDYNKGAIPRKLTHKIVMVLEYIEQKFDYAVIRSIENTNNVLTNISDIDKAIIQKSCKAVLDAYEYQPNSILKMLE